ncbi:hypothetical protein SLEP1_g6880 [Rubroshorea leprosula]|uniref:Uncharacterized protein n=1 Tax=Rubroshorea leprosula TaxID=152421 RepID=A0AAV5I2M1_9ROSI|nr:hypothetical protein SLEP1_g6880 [Rubroshorea leprosula]
MQAKEGEGSLPWDRYGLMFHLVEDGNQAFQANQFQDTMLYRHDNRCLTCKFGVLREAVISTLR